MRNRTTLDPEDRVLYGDSLQPPPGYVFDAGVAMTYSLDFETALAAPVSLALFAAENREDVLSDPLALLEGAERIAGRLVIFVDVGRIQAQSQPQSRLCSLLERMIVEVAAPRGGAFHPKVWVLRFKPVREGEPLRIRLLVLSRNLTRDRSWDLSLRLDGEVTRRPQGANRVLVEFLKRLPDLPTPAVSGDARVLIDELADDLRHTVWEVPEPFESVAFAVNGFGGRPWQPQACVRLGVISPFCDDATLTMLADLPTAEKPILIGRADELALVSTAILNRFDRVSVLDELAASEDGEELDPHSLEGLHAKAFIAEVGWDTIVTVGSGNATRPALITGSNVEVFATLAGKRSKVGSVEDILGPKGFGRLVRAFAAGEISPVDAEDSAAEARVEKARGILCRGGLRLRCEEAPAEGTGQAAWRVWLIPSEPLPLDGIGALSVWPITRGQDHGRDALDSLRQGQPVDLGSMPLVDLSRFVAFRLVDGTERASALFSIGLVLEGLPADRHSAILRWLINNRDAFFRYLRLLLLELGDPFGAALAAQKSAARKSWGESADDEPLFEEMVCAFCRGGDRLHAVERLIARLESPDQPGQSLIPDDFRILWEAFRIALKNTEFANGR